MTVAYSLTNVLGQEFRDEWRSDVGRQPGHMSCGMCYTDFTLSFEEDGAQAVRVRVGVYKDLGGVARDGGPDESWDAAVGKVGGVQRPRGDFGRVRSAFR